MPLIIPSNSISAGGYEVANSVRLNDGSSDYLNRTISSTGNRKTFTYSTWLKRGNMGSYQPFMGDVTDAGNDYFTISFQSGDHLNIYSQLAGPGVINISTNKLFRDTSAWYHIVLEVDTTQATASDRLKLYVNGSQETSFSTATYPNQNTDLAINISGETQVVGAGHLLSSYTFDGYMAESVFIDGTAYDPTSFGEFDEDSGIWKPIDVSGLTFGTNGFYLDFENSGSLGADVSGNGNNFTVNNLTAIDQTTDTPTNNFCTMNPLDYSGTAPTLSDGNLHLSTAVTSDNSFRSTIAVSKGKWYTEWLFTDSANNNHYGIWSADKSLTANYIGYQLYSWGIFTGNGNKRNNQSYDSYGSAIAQNDIVMIALDKDNGKIWWGKNGTWFNSGNPATGSNEAFSNINTVVGSDGYVAFASLTQTTTKYNFGNPPFTISSGNTDGNGYGNFEYAVPSGYLSLCTKNLSEVLG